MSIKVLHVLTAPRAEGTPRLVLDWLEVKEYNQEVLFLNYDGELKSDFLAHNIFQLYNSKFIPSFKALFKIIRLSYSVSKERKPDIVISWTSGFSPWIHLGAKLAGVKKLIVHAGNPPDSGFLRRYLFSYMSFWIGFLLKNKVVTCSNYIRDEYRAIPLLCKNQFQSVYNCFNYNKFSNIEIKEKIIRRSNYAVMVATLEKHKDHETLLKAWKIIESKGYDYYLELAGDGSLNNSLRALAAEMKLENVKFLGSQKNIPKLMHSSKVFILSTTGDEGFGTVLLEALASDCIIIATDVPACKEVLQNGKFGILATHQNSIVLADKIIEAFNLNDLYPPKSQREEYLKNFTPHVMINSYINLFN